MPQTILSDSEDEFPSQLAPKRARPVADYVDSDVDMLSLDNDDAPMVASTSTKKRPGSPVSPAVAPPQKRTATAKGKAKNPKKKESSITKQAASSTISAFSSIINNINKAKVTCARLIVEKEEAKERITALRIDLEKSKATTLAFTKELEDLKTSNAVALQEARSHSYHLQIELRKLEKENVPPPTSQVNPLFSSSAFSKGFPTATASFSGTAPIASTPNNTSSALPFNSNHTSFGNQLLSAPALHPARGFKPAQNFANSPASTSGLFSRTNV
ncbi:hypothetical protein R3P38DRAFT_2992352 [Favolaschia claudopus]|uniref:Uncharacterized protein n=1 Tax=Favolaschia claudopus TaxID=2862362 RepID=A0AAW0ATX0_9AGAR